MFKNRVLAFRDAMLRYHVLGAGGTVLTPGWGTKIFACHMALAKQTKKHPKT